MGGAGEMGVRISTQEVWDGMAAVGWGMMEDARRCMPSGLVTFIQQKCGDTQQVRSEGGAKTWYTHVSKCKNDKFFLNSHFTRWG
jgi:ribosomal protein L32E